MVYQQRRRGRTEDVMAWWTQVVRRVRYGAPLVIVSGLPRSGTSMMMKMLDAGGLPIWTDGRRAADDQNPHGYYELERVKELDKPLDKAWLREGRGRGLKVISALLEHLPDDNNYQVVFMHRDLDEVLASQSTMLKQRGAHPGEGDDASLKSAYAAHLGRVSRLLRQQPQFTALDVAYASALADPAGTAVRIKRFLGVDLDVAGMAAAVDAALYRNRHVPRP